MIPVAAGGDRPLPVCADRVFKSETGWEYDRDTLIDCKLAPGELSDVDVHCSWSRKKVIGDPRNRLATRIGK